MHASRCDDLDGYLDETLSESKRKGFEAHLQSCLHCQRELHVQRQVNSLLGKAAHFESVPRSLVDRIERRIGEASRRRWSRAIGIATAAMIVLAVGGWLGWRRMQGRESVPIVEKNQPDDRRAIPADIPRREKSEPLAVAEVTVGPTFDGIVVPLKSENSNVAIFWIYPSLPQSNALQN